MAVVLLPLHSKIKKLKGKSKWGTRVMASEIWRQRVKCESLKVTAYLHIVGFETRLEWHVCVAVKRVKMTSKSFSFLFLRTGKIKRTVSRPEQS